MERGDGACGGVEKSIDLASDELEGLKFDSREGTPSDRGFAQSLKEEECILQEIKKSVALGSQTLDLSFKGLLQIPEEILEMTALENLYLEGNELNYLPDEFFDCLPNLKWLDLRNNKLSRLPNVYLGRHQNLKNLLLEQNNLKSLPLELGLVKSLTGLNFRNNPFEFPPKEIMDKGVKEILKFLYEMLQAKVSTETYEYEDEIPNYDDDGSDHSEDDWLNDYTREDTHVFSRLPPKPEQLVKTDLVGPVPLSAELHRPISYADRKQQHVEKLKRAGALGTLDSLMLRHHLLKRRRKHQVKPTSRKLPRFPNSVKRPLKENVMEWQVNPYPEPPPPDLVDIKMAEERRVAKVKELKQRQEAILQRRRDQQTLKDWRDEGKKLQQRKFVKSMYSGGLDYDEPVRKAPFAVEAEHFKVLTNEQRIKADVKAAHDKLRRPISPGTKQRIETEKTARIKELEKRIKEHSTVMLERRKQPQGTPQQEMEAAKKELAIAEQLQTELKARRNNLEYRFKAFTPDLTSGYTKTTRLKGTT